LFKHSKSGLPTRIWRGVSIRYFCVEYNAAPNKSTWLIGEDIERRAGHLALRSMSDPKVANQILMVELTGRIKPNVDQAVEMIIVVHNAGSKSLDILTQVRLEQMILEV
jgi:hypothetical protein